jgi:hypothetical protein
MSSQHAGFTPPDDAAGAVVGAAREADAGPDGAADNADDFGLLAAADREHLQREIAAIERATEALRKAEPGLESWSDMPAPAVHKPRPIWLLIGVLWLSTALVTIGAAFALSALVG